MMSRSFGHIYAKSQIKSPHITRADEDNINHPLDIFKVGPDLEGYYR